MSFQATVKWFDSQKGYGFLTREGQADLFVHFSAIKAEGFKKLHQGDVVKFEVSKTDRGEQATEVEIVTKAPTKKPASKAPATAETTPPATE